MAVLKSFCKPMLPISKSPDKTNGTNKLFSLSMRSPFPTNEKNQMGVYLRIQKLLPTGSDKTKLREVTEPAPSQSFPDNSIYSVTVFSLEKVKKFMYKHEIWCT